MIDGKQNLNKMQQFNININNWTLSIILCSHILSSWLCYVFSKFACKIQIQNFSFSFPINLTMIITVILLLIFGGLREINTCIFKQFIDNYLFFDTPSIHRMDEFIMKEYAWIWIFTIISQAWITKV